MSTEVHLETGKTSTVACAVERPANRYAEVAGRGLDKDRSR